MILPDPDKLAAVLDVCKDRGPLRLRIDDFELVLGGMPEPSAQTPEDRRQAALEAAAEEAMMPFVGSGMMPKQIARPRVK